jgi:NAD(P)-dependent dehydrogenase (short-subunit alcohol dehydrogenase family)
LNPVKPNWIKSLSQKARPNVAPWTTNQIPDLSDKTVVITGANSGLGFESAKALANRGAEVILACRSEERGENARQEILAQIPHAKLHAMTVNLQDLSSVENFARTFVENFDRLDVLLNNAGIMNTPYGLTNDGFETQMGTNHLGHFALTGQLLDMLKGTARSRVVIVSSSAHRAGTMNFDNLLFQNGQKYTPLKAYGRSKLANLLFAYELQRHFDRHGIDCIGTAAHPGASQTNLGRHIEHTLPFKLFNPLLQRVVQGPASGALPQLRAAVDPQVRGGEYYGPDGALGMSGYPVRVRSNRASRSLPDAEKLWQESERLTGVTYSFS